MSLPKMTLIIAPSLFYTLLLNFTSLLELRELDLLVKVMQILTKHTFENPCWKIVLLANLPPIATLKFRTL